MATTPLPRGQQGLYEQAVTANVPWSVQVGITYPFVGELLEVTNHGTGQLYMRRGATIALRDPMAYMVNPSEIIEIDVSTAADTLTFISAVDTIVSVARAS